LTGKSMKALKQFAGMLRTVCKATNQSVPLHLTINDIFANVTAVAGSDFDASSLMSEVNWLAELAQTTDIIVCRYGVLENGDPYLMVPSVRQADNAPHLVYGWALEDACDEKDQPIIKYANFSMPAAQAKLTWKVKDTHLGDAYVVGATTFVEGEFSTDIEVAIGVANDESDKATFIQSCRNRKPDWSKVRQLPGVGGNFENALKFEQIEGTGTVHNVTRKIIKSKKDGTPYVIASVVVRTGDASHGTMNTYEGFISKGFAELFYPNPGILQVTKDGVVGGSGKYPKWDDVRGLHNLKVVSAYTKQNKFDKPGEKPRSWTSLEVIVVADGIDPIALSLGVADSNPVSATLMLRPKELHKITQATPAIVLGDTCKPPYSVTEGRPALSFGAKPTLNFAALAAAPIVAPTAPVVDDNAAVNAFLGINDLADELEPPDEDLPEDEGLDPAALLAATTTELKRLGWDNKQGSAHLRKNFSGKKTRAELTEAELGKFLAQLRAIPTPAQELAEVF
jgi:hypothetical protein